MIKNQILFQNKIHSQVLNVLVDLFIILRECFFVLQWMSVPFALANPAVSDISVTAVTKVFQTPWLGKIHSSDGWMWADNFCLLVM